MMRCVNSWGRSIIANANETAGGPLSLLGNLGIYSIKIVTVFGVI